MNRLFFLLIASASFLSAQDPFTWEANGFLFSRGDFNADGRHDMVIVDAQSGSIRLVNQLSNGSFTWGEIQPSGIESPEALAVGKFYGATNDAIAVGSSTSNRIHLFGLTNPAEIFTPAVIYPSAPGPTSLAAMDVNATGTTDMIAICEGLAPLANKGRGRVYEAIVSVTAVPPVTHWSRNYPTPTYRINPVRPKTGYAPRIGEIYGDSPATFYLEVVDTLGLSGGITVSGLTSASRYSVGSLDATGLTHVMFWTPDQTTLRTARVQEPTTGNFTFYAPVDHTLPAGIRFVVPIQTGAGGRIAVLFIDGTVRVYDFDGISAPIERWSLTGFPGDMILPVGTNDFVVASGLRGATPQWRRYAPISNTYGMTQNGTAPVANDARRYSNILFLSAEPFVNPGVEPKLFSSFRDWTILATASNGLAWDIQSLAYNGSASGLGSAQTTTLSGTSVSDFALLNQYSNALSLFSMEQKTGSHLCDVVFSPPPGNYAPPSAVPSVLGAPIPEPLPFLQVSVAATEPGFVLRYRTSPSADYVDVPSSGLINISASTTLQVYAFKSNERSPVRSATYTFLAASSLSLPASIDADQDGLPDAWEAAFGVSNPTSDDDLDGYTNYEEAQFGGDPNLIAPIPDIAPRLIGSLQTLPGNIKFYRIQWPAGDTLSILESSTNLQSWQEVINNPSISGNQRQLDFILNPLVPKRFYRLRRP